LIGKENIMNTTNKRMPVIFVGHGSPMNALEENEYTKGWEDIAKQLPRPKAILAISAHWYTDGTRITDSDAPNMVYDMYGFPEELYKIEYKAKGAPEIAHLTRELIQREVKIDNSWGFDHGTWSILHKMYPQADIPVYQLSVDQNADAQTHYQMGKEIASLRDKEVLIFASGNVVHNLRMLDWDNNGGHPWAEEFNQFIKVKVTNKQYDEVIHFEKAGKAALFSVPTPEHFYPLLYVLGASAEEDSLTIFNDSCTLGSLSMTSYLLG
jgi:4,5-DOPA dioxygenase extradiol